MPAWLSVSDNISVTADFPQTVFVNVDRSVLMPGDSVSHVIEIVATTSDGEMVGSQSITVLAAVDP